MGKVLMSGIVPKLTVPSLIPSDAPEQWEFMVAYSSNATFVAEEDMWIRVHSFGECGDGYGSTSIQRESGGGGGNSGGYACSEFIIEQGTSVILDFTNGTAKFGEHLYATAGGNASGGSPSSTVGQGYGGNKYNLAGFKGGSAGSPPDAGTAGANNGAKGGSGSPVRVSKGYYAGSGGGGGARLPVPYEPFPYVPSSLSGYSGGAARCASGTGGFYGGSDGSSYPALDLTAPMLYGGGNGGGGGGSFEYYEDAEMEVEVHETKRMFNGSAGSPACIIIEKGVY